MQEQHTVDDLFYLDYAFRDQDGHRITRRSAGQISGGQRSVLHAHFCQRATRPKQTCFLRPPRSGVGVRPAAS